MANKRGVGSHLKMCRIEVENKEINDIESSRMTVIAGVLIAKLNRLLKVYCVGESTYIKVV